ncbi:hypothetical protein EZE20_18045 [Arundinibacter roseus]|uniref:Uncharacterized protein n=1 Tax=Arundinibacter roseus TaxID=2070510 RepID=A0A4R4K4F0_9BACT|nr:hypothetical protein EZE20_18045 [Arundinibacter roseus]
MAGVSSVAFGADAAGLAGAAFLGAAGRGLAAVVAGLAAGAAGLAAGAAAFGADAAAGVGVVTGSGFLFPAFLASFLASFPAARSPFFFAFSAFF